MLLKVLEEEMLCFLQSSLIKQISRYTVVYTRRRVIEERRGISGNISVICYCTVKENIFEIIVPFSTESNIQHVRQ